MSASALCPHQAPACKILQIRPAWEPGRLLGGSLSKMFKESYFNLFLLLKHSLDISRSDFWIRPGTVLSPCVPKRFPVPLPGPNKLIVQCLAQRPENVASRDVLLGTENRQDNQDTPLFQYKSNLNGFLKEKWGIITVVPLKK